MSEWKTYTLGEIAEITSSKRIFLADYVSEGIPFYRSKEVIERFKKNNVSTELFIEKSKFEEIRNKFGAPTENDILLTSVGTIGIPFKVKKDDEFYFKDGNLTWFRNYNGKILPDYLFYWIQSSIGKDAIEKTKIGSTQQALTIASLKQIEIQAPDEATQTQIAQILTSLDDKIELNLQMNQTLEAMAQALFKEWFVNFNFPGFNGELENGLPKGWRIGKLSDIIEIKHGYAFKGDFFSDFEEEDILITPGNFKIGGGFNSQKFKYYNGDIPKDYILNRNDLIVTMTDLSKAGDTLGYSALVPTIEGKRLLHNQRIGKVIFKSDLPVKYFLYWLMRQDDYRYFVLGGATGSTVKHTSPTRICEFEFPLPTKELLSKFETKISSLSDKAQENEIQINTLTRTRDTLLPKLMSGKIEIKN